MSSSPLKCIASRSGDAKAIGQLNQSSQPLRSIAGRDVHGVVGEKIGRTAEFEEIAELIEIACEGALVAAVGDAGAAAGVQATTTAARDILETMVKSLVGTMPVSFPFRG